MTPIEAVGQLMKAGMLPATKRKTIYLAVRSAFRK